MLGKIIYLWMVNLNWVIKGHNSKCESLLIIISNLALKTKKQKCGLGFIIKSKSQITILKCFTYKKYMYFVYAKY